MLKVAVDPPSALNALNAAALDWVKAHPPYGVVIIDMHSRVQGWNPWMVLHSGRAVNEVVGRHLIDVFPDLVERGLSSHFDEALAGHVRLVSHRLHGFLIRLPTDRAGGDFPCMQQSSQIAPLMCEGQVVGAIATITDVTDRVVRESELQSELIARARHLVDERAAHAEANASNSAKDEFLAVLSHELRTPMHAILGWAQVLGEGSVPPERLAHGIAAIARNGLLQTQLIDDLLDVSRIVSGNLAIDIKPVALRRAIEAAVCVIQPLADAKGVELVVSIADDLAPVLGDAGRLQQIVWNLLGNTVKFTPRGGKVSLTATSDATRVSITVVDTGQGISAAFLPCVFDRFRQSDSSKTRPQGGLGLGLSIVKRLVELHGGTVTAASRGAGLGATFVVTLPRGDGPPGGKPSVPPLSSSSRDMPHNAPLGGMRILFVDDDPDGREIMALALSLEGADVVIAESAPEARTALFSHRPDIIISDIGMPGEDGYALIRSIRHMSGPAAHTPAIALTGYGGLDDRCRAREAGFDAHLTKPADLGVLLSHVTSLMGRSATVVT